MAKFLYKLTKISLVICPILLWSPTPQMHEYCSLRQSLHLSTTPYVVLTLLALHLHPLLNSIWNPPHPALLCWCRTREDKLKKKKKTKNPNQMLRWLLTVYILYHHLNSWRVGSQEGRIHYFPGTKCRARRNGFAAW